MAIKKGSSDITIGTPAPAWMLTYSDLITQILIFFVMLFALSAAGVEDQLKEIKKRIEAYVLANNLQNSIFLDLNEKGLIISLRDRLMFASGEAEIFNEAKIILKDITSILLEYPNNMRIEGHTDNVPINTTLYPSNWELSTARATNLTRYLIEELRFPPPRLSSSGYGEFQPVVPNATLEGKARNRRVDLLVARLSLQQQKIWRASRSQGKTTPFQKVS